MAMQKYKNTGKVDRILPGNTKFHDTRCMPGAIVEIDPEHLKIFAPEDVADLVPVTGEEPKPAPVGKPPLDPADEDPDGHEAGELVKLLTQANNVGPQE